MARVPGIARARFRISDRPGALVQLAELEVDPGLAAPALAEDEGPRLLDLDGPGRLAQAAGGAVLVVEDERDVAVRPGRGATRSAA